MGDLYVHLSGFRNSGRENLSSVFMIEMVMNRSAFRAYIQSERDLTHKSHISLGSFLWDKGKQNSPRCDTTKRRVPSGAIRFADMNFIKK